VIVIYKASSGALKVGLLVFLELWLGMADEHEEPLSCGSGWRVLPVSVCWLWPVRMGLDRLPSSVVGLRVW